MIKDIPVININDQDSNSERSNKRCNNRASTNSNSSPYSYSTSTKLDRLRERKEDIEYPIFKRSHSTKVFHVIPDLSNEIKEELNEEEDLTMSNKLNRLRFSPKLLSQKTFSPKTFMPKEMLIFENKFNKSENLLNTFGSQIRMMDTIPELDDEKLLKNEQLLLKSPRIRLTSDIEEEKIVPNKSLNIIKTGLDEEDIIKEEKEGENINEIDEFSLKKKSKMIQFQNFIDKEEPPNDVGNIIIDKSTPELEGDAIKEDTEGENVADKDMTTLSQIQKNEVIVDEIDDDRKVPKVVRSIFSHLDEDLIINELDEYNNINNGF